MGANPHAPIPRTHSEKLEAKIQAFPLLRNYPQTTTPGFLAPQLSAKKKATSKTAQKTPAPHPRQTAAFILKV
jgi:hypothetical protein